MRKLLVIPFAALFVVIASCAQVKAPASAESSSASAANAASSAKANSALGSNDPHDLNDPNVPKPGTASSPSMSNDGAAPFGVTLPALPGMGDDGFDDYPVPVGPLPGDMRGNLRTPDMPSTLPMSVDGKINSSDF